uniref:Transmembrane protein n=1 Tax=Cucumis sativus TaxID=3659 RepID=A0A0A0KU63_CUCSA
MEKVDVRRVSSGAKILGTAVAVGGAMIMTFVEGPKLRFPWTNRHYNSHNYPSTSSTNVNNKDSFKGVLLVTLSCLCASVSCILQVHSNLNSKIVVVILKNVSSIFSRTYYIRFNLKINFIVKDHRKKIEVLTSIYVDIDSQRHQKKVSQLT